MMDGQMDWGFGSMAEFETSGDPCNCFFCSFYAGTVTCFICKNFRQERNSTAWGDISLIQPEEHLGEDFWEVNCSREGWEQELCNCKCDKHQSAMKLCDTHNFFRFLFSSGKHPPLPTKVLSALIDDDPELLIRDYIFIPYQNDQRETLLGMAIGEGAPVDIIRLIVREIWSRVSGEDRRRLKTPRIERYRTDEKREEEDKFFEFVDKGMFRSTAFGGDFHDRQRYQRPEMTHDVLVALLEEYPDGALEETRTSGGWGEIFGDACDSRAGRALMTGDRASEEFWGKFKLILRAYSLGKLSQGTVSQDSTKEFSELHSYLEMICNGGERSVINSGIGVHYRIGDVLSTLDFLKQKVPEQFTKRNEKGMYPLHTFLLVQRVQVFGAAGRDQDQIREMVKYLLESDPRSAGACDPTGILPLHLAALRGLTCIDVLCDAEPRALATRCPIKYGETIAYLYPFQIAQLKAGALGLDIAFELLRRSPNMSHGLAEQQREPWMENDVYKAWRKKKTELTRLQAEVSVLEMKLEDIKKNAAGDSSNTGKRKRDESSS